MQNSCIGDEILAQEALVRRQKMTTWGIVGLAVFVSVGMAEWSKRTAASETVIDPAVMQEALKIAAAREGIRGLVVSHGGNGERESGKRNSDLSGESRVAGPDRVGAGDALRVTSSEQLATIGSREGREGAKGVLSSREGAKSVFAEMGSHPFSISQIPSASRSEKAGTKDELGKAKPTATHLED